MENKAVFEKARQDFEAFIMNGSGNLDTQELTALSYHLEHLTQYEANDANINKIENKVKLKRNLSYGFSFVAGCLAAGTAISQADSLSGILFLSSLSALSCYKGYKISNDNEYYQSLMGEPKYAHLLRIRMLLSKGMGLGLKDPLLSTNMLEAIASACSDNLKATLEQRLEKNHLVIGNALMEAIDDPLRTVETQLLYRAASDYRLLYDLRERISDIKSNKESHQKNTWRTSLKGSELLQRIPSPIFFDEMKYASQQLTELIENISGINLSDTVFVDNLSLYKIALLIDNVRQSKRYFHPEVNKPMMSINL